MADPLDMIVPMLREMRVENQARHGEVLGRFDVVERRLKAVELDWQRRVRELESSS
jgi:hypothetical protein